MRSGWKAPGVGVEDELELATPGGTVFRSSGSGQRSLSGAARAGARAPVGARPGSGTAWAVRRRRTRLVKRAQPLLRPGFAVVWPLGRAAAQGSGLARVGGPRPGST